MCREYCLHSNSDHVRVFLGFQLVKFQMSQLICFPRLMLVSIWSATVTPLTTPKSADQYSQFKPSIEPITWRLTVSLKWKNGWMPFAEFVVYALLKKLFVVESLVSLFYVFLFDLYYSFVYYLNISLLCKNAINKLNQG